MKRYIVILMIVFGLSSSVWGMTSVNVIVNGKVIHSLNPVIQKEGTLLAPLKEMSEALKLRYNYDYSTKEVSFDTGFKRLSFRPYQKWYSSNGLTRKLEVPPLVIKGNLFLPIEVICKEIKMPFIWEDKTQTVLINSTMNDMNKLYIPMTREEGLKLLKELVPSVQVVSLEKSFNRVYNEPNSEFYYYKCTQYKGGFYVNKYTAEVYEVNAEGGLSPKTILRESLDKKITKQAEEILNDRVILVKQLTTASKHQLFLFQSVSTKKRLLIGADNRIYDLVAYQKTGKMKAI